MIEVLTAAEATERLRAVGLKISPETLRDGIQQGVFPFGGCIMNGDKVKWCYIYVNLMENWIKEREK
jgi:hypothetical protein